MNFSEVETWNIPEGEAYIVSCNNEVLWRKKFQINLIPSPTEGGSINLPSGKYPYGLPINLIATANDGYGFNKWSTGQTDSSINYMVENEADLIAYFQKLTSYDVTLNANGGTINTGNVTEYTYGVGAELPTDVTKTDYDFSGWFDNESLTGNRIYSIGTQETGDKEFWAKWEEQSPLINQLYFEAQEKNSTIKLENVAGTYKTSTDGKTWTDYTLGTELSLLNIGDKIYFSAISSNDTCYLNHNAPKFSMSGKIAAEGNIQYLLDSTGECLSVPNNCYEYIFANCSSLTQAPVLPATTLATHCYDSMFRKCTSLTKTPVLSSTELCASCYYYMFYFCTSLTSATNLPATVIPGCAYTSMFTGCAITTPPSISAETLIHNEMADQQHMDGMFAYTKLSSIPELKPNYVAPLAYDGMFSGCQKLSSVLCLSATSLDVQCYSGMFMNCSSLTAAPVISASKFPSLACSYMFYNCVNLSISTEDKGYMILSAKSGTDRWSKYMFTGTAGDFTEDPTTGTPYYCY